MKVSAIQIGSIKNHTIKPNGVKKVISDPTFGIANSGKLRILFAYDLPCMYSGVEMIDPKRVQKLIKNKAFEQPIFLLLKTLEPFEHRIKDVEGKIYRIIKDEAKLNPYLTLQEVFKSLEPTYQKRLIKKQIPILNEIVELAHNLPDGYRYKFNQFMVETNNKLQGKPVVVPFSTKEFRYKLEKIREDINEQQDFKGVKVLNKMLKETERLSDKTNTRNIEHQKKVISFLNIIHKKSILKDYAPLKDLLKSSTEKLELRKTLVNFTRKSFIYDLANLLEGLPDIELQEQLLTLAQSLPTSRESTSAYIVKFAKEPSEKIAYRLLWPSMASVEHILPKSCGGADEMYNFGGATTRENSERKNSDFVTQIKRKPETKINCQKYVNKLIELVKDGIFDLHKIDTKYIKDFKNTIQKQSKGAIVLDTKEI